MNYYEERIKKLTSQAEQLSKIHCEVENQLHELHRFSLDLVKEEVLNYIEDDSVEILHEVANTGVRFDVLTKDVAETVLNLWEALAKLDGVAWQFRRKSNEEKEEHRERLAKQNTVAENSGTGDGTNG